MHLRDGASEKERMPHICFTDCLVEHNSLHRMMTFKMKYFREVLFRDMKNSCTEYWKLFIYEMNTERISLMKLIYNDIKTVKRYKRNVALERKVILVQLYL